MAQNVRNAMLNQIVQNVIDSRVPDTGHEQITIKFDEPLDLYLDMFTDSASLDHYVIANDLNIDSDDCLKFAQVFKNNLVDIDESNMVDGNVYRHLSDNIASAFGSKSNILVVDSPSIEVKRIKDSKGNDVDTFTYNVLMDVHIMQNKEWMKKHSTYDGKYVIANAVVKDMECSVTITPTYNKDDGNISYEAKYVVNKKPSDRDTYDVEYNQIVYNYNGKTKHMTTAETRKVQDGVNFLDVVGLNLTYSTKGNLKVRTTQTTRIIIDEIISKEI